MGHDVKSALNENRSVSCHWPTERQRHPDRGRPCIQPCARRHKPCHSSQSAERSYRARHRRGRSSTDADGATRLCCYTRGSLAPCDRSQSGGRGAGRSEEHTSELQSLMRISYAVFRLNKKKYHNNQPTSNQHIAYKLEYT